MKNDKTLPAPTINLSVAETPEKQELVERNKMLSYLTNVLDEIQEDRKEIDTIMNNFLEMVTNGGDSSSSSKEALVNLVKLKTETADKKTKILDLMMRAYLKERDTFPKYLTAHQHNEYKINSRKTNLLKALEEDDK